MSFPKDSIDCKSVMVQEMAEMSPVLNELNVAIALYRASVRVSFTTMSLTQAAPFANLFLVYFIV